MVEDAFVTRKVAEALLGRRVLLPAYAALAVAVPAFVFAV